jgi:hypothetical protein
VLIVLLIVALAFGLLFMGRLAGARRALLAEHWPAFLLASAAIFVLARGNAWLALALLVAGGLAFVLRAPKRPQRAAEDPADREAMRVLGVDASAGAEEIRAAYRAKMAQAHPDRGGSHSEAARLTAARDRLLRSRR